MESRTVYVVLLYGIYYPERIAYAAYLDRVARALLQFERPLVLLCGGVSNPDFPGLSEAESAREYLSKTGHESDWMLEEASLTTYENIFNAAHLLADRVDGSTQYVVFTDMTRQAKSSWLAMHLLCHLPTRQAYELFVDHSSTADLGTDFIAPRLRVVGLEYESGAIPENLRQTYSAIRDIIPLDHPELKDVLLSARRREFHLA